jgi:hypothetical protein
MTQAMNKAMNASTTENSARVNRWGTGQRQVVKDRLQGNYH